MWKNLCIGFKKVHNPDENVPTEYINIDFEKPGDLLGFCNVMAEYIIKKYERKLVTKIISSNYYYLSPADQHMILQKAINLSHDEELNLLLTEKRKKIIADSLMQYLTYADLIVLNGFVIFRLPEYMNELDELVYVAAESCITKREFTNFIEMLRYFVLIKEEKTKILHIIPQADSSYKLLDECYNEVTSGSDDTNDESASNDDKLADSLISLAPEKIIIHKKELIKNTRLLNTIKQVFIHKVDFCKGCSLCNTTY